MVTRLGHLFTNGWVVSYASHGPRAKASLNAAVGWAMAAHRPLRGTGLSENYSDAILLLTNPERSCSKSLIPFSGQSLPRWP